MRFVRQIFLFVRVTIVWKVKLSNATDEQTKNKCIVKNNVD